MATVPGTLATTNLDPASTATTSGPELRFATGQIARWSVTPTTPGDHWLRFRADAPFGARMIVRVDGVQRYAQQFFASAEEEESTMPAHSAVESVVTAPASGSAAVRADATPTPNRYRIRIVNTDVSNPGVRVFVARSQTDAGASTAEVIESDFGIWEDYLDANCQVWIRSSSATVTPAVRVIQYATA